MNYNKIKDLCNVNKITLKDLSSQLNISEHGLHAMIRNNTMQIKVLEHIAEKLKVPVCYFFEDKEQEKSDVDKVLKAITETFRDMVKTKMK